MLEKTYDPITHESVDVGVGVMRLFKPDPNVPKEDWLDQFKYKGPMVIGSLEAWKKWNKPTHDKQSSKFVDILVRYSLKSGYRILSEQKKVTDLIDVRPDFFTTHLGLSVYRITTEGYNLLKEIPSVNIIAFKDEILKSSAVYLMIPEAAVLSMEFITADTK